MDDETTERDGTAGPAPAGLPKGPSEPREENIRVLDRRWWARAKSDDAGESSASDSDKPSYVRELEQRLAAKDDELRATITRYREANTEFEQARVRFRRDVAKDVERGRRAILADLLEVLDNLDRAVAAARDGSSDTALVLGVDMVRAQFLDKLQGHGVRIVNALHQPFDPAVHEAVTTVPVSDPGQDGRVVGVIRQGYAIGDELLRPAVVAVAAVTPEGAR